MDYLVYFVKISFCDVLLQRRSMQMECVTALIQELEKLKLSASTESATAAN